MKGSREFWLHGVQVGRATLVWEVGKVAQMESQNEKAQVYLPEEHDCPAPTTVPSDKAGIWKWW